VLGPLQTLLLKVFKITQVRNEQLAQVPVTSISLFTTISILNPHSPFYTAPITQMEEVDREILEPA
jgi:hypothetical protein